MSHDIAIIGAGAAGCFCAIELKRRLPHASVTIYEAGRTPLAKVAVTGGGRCNFTNSFENVKDMRQAYPRGAVLMKRALNVFGNEDTIEWFGKEGVEAVLQEDHCWFPKSQDAMQIVETLLRLCDRAGVEILCGSAVEDIVRKDGGEGFVVRIRGGLERHHDTVVVTAGGGRHHFLDGLGVKTIPCVPSLFSLNIKDEGLNALMGTVVDKVRLGVAGEKISAEGTLLLSHWGISGPVTLNLSAYAARLLAQKSYRNLHVNINWLCAGEQECRRTLAEKMDGCDGKAMGNCRPDALASRLWTFLLKRSGIKTDLKCAELGKTALNRLVNTLTNDRYEIAGKCKFQPGFVNSGGVCLDEINFNTLEHKTLKGLFFAGEVLDIDAITGGFNLQAAWTTAYIAAHSIC